MESGTSPKPALRRAWYEGDKRALEILERGLRRPKIASTAQANDEQEVLCLLESRADPNTHDFEGSVALHYAAAKGNIM